MSQDSPRDERVVSITIQAPVERVWDEITKTGTLQPAVYNTVLDCDMTPGSRLRYYSQNKKRVPFRSGIPTYTSGSKSTCSTTCSTRDR